MYNSVSFDSPRSSPIFNIYQDLTRLEDQVCACLEEVSTEIVFISNGSQPPD